ncbi:flagellin FliC, partial [Yersinia enterocolitica]
MEEINRVTKQTDFNGIKVLDNRTATDSSYDFQVGSKDNEQISIAIGKSSGWNLATAKADGTSTDTVNTYAFTKKAALDTAQTDYDTANTAYLKAVKDDAANGTTTATAAKTALDGKSTLLATAVKDATAVNEAVNGKARTVAAKGFDVLSGTVDSAGVATGTTPLADIDKALK